MFHPFKTVLNTIRTATEKFWTDAVNVRTALENFQMDDASRSNGAGKIQTGDTSHSNGERKISNGWCHPFERLTKNFERMTPGVRTAKETFGTYFSRRSNGRRKGFVLNEWLWTALWLNVGDVDVLIKDMFLLPFRRSVAVILITHFFISTFKTWQNLEMGTKSF